MKRYWIAIIVLIMLTPLGLLAEGTAWGEWGVEEIDELLGFVPQGMAHYPVTWSGFLPDYGFVNRSDTFLGASLEYIFSAVLGTVLVVMVFTCIRLWIGRTHAS